MPYARNEWFTTFLFHLLRVTKSDLLYLCYLHFSRSVRFTLRHRVGKSAEDFRRGYDGPEAPAPTISSSSFIIDADRCSVNHTLYKKM